MTNQTRLPGVLGGMGPDATIDFLNKVLSLTPALSDQDHLRLIIDQNPHVPNRQTQSSSPPNTVGAAIAEMARRLQRYGADFLVMPCNSAHAFIDELLNSVSVPFLNILDCTLTAARDTGCTRFGVLATDGCLESGIYQARIVTHQESIVIPDTKNIGLLMDSISKVKSRNFDIDEVRRTLVEIANSLASDGAELIIAGCTEIPLVLKHDNIQLPLIDSTKELAQATVREATRRVRVQLSEGAGMNVEEDGSPNL